MRNRVTPTLAAAALAVLALSACAGDDGSGGSAQSERERFQEAALKHAECLRRHGIDAPDPKPNGGLVLRGDDVDPQRLERAQLACDKEVGKLPAPEMSAKEQREFREAALKHARCMRSQGLEFPDPTFGANGTARIEMPGGGGPPLDDPAFRAADAKCRKFLNGAGVASPEPGE